MSFFVKACIVAQGLPAVNGEVDGDIIYKNHYDIGVVGTEQGLSCR
jgi:pyruvate/2-oxoglutarate dehydrogenase complex dihydrolipoamide acyltransferase (E2) component